MVPQRAGLWPPSRYDEVGHRDKRRYIVLMGSIRENLKEVRARIAAAAERAGRADEEVRLVAVSKTRPPDRLADAILSGVEILGENRVQEAREKRAKMDPELAGRARWHLVGSLQKNKARLVPGLFDTVESVDSLALAQELARRVEGSGAVPLEIFVQVNTGEEGQKGGVAPGEVQNLLKETTRLSALKAVGLMCLPPFEDNPEKSRAHFRLLRRLRDEALGAGLETVTELSMGMSADYEVAIEEGATFVRIGTAIFGERSPGLA